MPSTRRQLLIGSLGVPAAMAIPRLSRADDPTRADWRSADSWHRDGVGTLRRWAGTVVERIGSDDKFKTRWLVGSLALYHAARIVPNAPPGWRTAADAASKALAKAEEAMTKEPAKAYSHDAVVGEAQPNYATPYALLVIEHMAAGIARSQADVANDKDRDPISALGFTPSWRRERLVACLTLLLIGDTGTGTTSKEPPRIQSNLPADTTASYTNWAGQDPGVTGGVLMGLQSAMNLQVLAAVRKMEQEKVQGVTMPHVDFGGMVVPITYEGFRDRWVDVLIHAILSFSFHDAGSTATPRFKPSEGATAVADVAAADLDNLPNAWEHGYRYREVDGEPRREVRVRKSPARPGGPTPRKRTFSYSGSSNPYQIASGGYALLVAAQLLRRTLADCARHGETKVGRQYPLEAKGQQWALTLEGTAPTRLTLVDPVVHSGIVLSGESIDGGNVAIDDRIDEAVNGLVLSLYPGGTLTELLANGKRKNEPYAVFAIGKFLVAAGYPEVVGHFPWHHDLCGQLTAFAEVAGQDDEYHYEFAILAALQAYQPTYPGAG